jgi:hypothetical protein
MRRSLAVLFSAFTAALAAGGCETPTSATADIGPVVALDSLRAADGAALPCCAADSAGARVSIVAGTLTFRSFAHYTDTANTPAGPRSAACVTEVANGAFIHENGLVTVGDSVAYLVIPCHVGTYALALTQRLDYLGGVSRTATVTVSSGTYQWKRDTLSLITGAGVVVAATMVRDTIIVVAPGHTYRLLAVVSR